MSDATESKLRCEHGCAFAIVRGVARFVDPRTYADSFGLQWNEFEKTQLDSFTHTTISQDRLQRILGGALSGFHEKVVLEAGCGAGRFTEIMLANGAKVFATDLSSAVEANHRNCGHYSEYFVCQADLRKLPVAQESFDVVVCIGVVQHTPNPEETMSALCSYVKPGGVLLMDHYSSGYPSTPIRRVLRYFLLKAPSKTALTFCRQLVRWLWPIHRLMWMIKKRFPRLRKIQSAFLFISPVVDYQDAYQELGQDRLREWAILDTHDTLTDRYKHIRSGQQITEHLRRNGMSEVEIACSGNGVEVRAIKRDVAAACCGNATES